MPARGSPWAVHSRRAGGASRLPNRFGLGVHRAVLGVAFVEEQAGRADLGHWLDPAAAEPAGLLPLLRPYAGAMTAYPVGTAVNSPRNDGPACVAPLA
jgi:hypothetical protein